MRWVFWLAGAAGLAMVGLGIYAVLAPNAAANAYGLPLTSADAAGWVQATGVRDLTLGVLSLVFAALKERKALGLLALCGAVVPIGDGWLVLSKGEVVPFVFLHWGSALACLVFSWLVLRIRPIGTQA